MNIIREYEQSLQSRYLKLYGKSGFDIKIRKAKQKLIIEAVIVFMIFVLLICNDAVTSKSEYSNVTVNNKGEITAVSRPKAGEDSYSFSATVKIKSDTGIREKEYYITIEPEGENSAADETVQPEELTDEQVADEELKSLISNLNDDTSSDVILPQSLENGDELVWTKTENTNVVLYIAGLLVILYMLYRNRFYEVTKEEKAARESITRELPEFINKLVLLINAGVILNTAFLKIVEDCDEKTLNSSYFYGRMADIGEMVKETNASFYTEMYAFARNSGVKELMRITNIMMDNVSKGDDLSDKLRRENELLWFARKQQAEEKGRLAETKLTLPLMILLTVLIVVTISPALMEI